jgi:hypothetical protein
MSMRNALLLVLATLAAVGLVQGLGVTVEHLDETSFPAHARFHAALSGIGLSAVAVLVLGLVWQAFQGARCGPLLVFGAAAIPASALLAAAMVPDGSPPPPFPALAGVGLVIAAGCAGALWWIDRRASARVAR